MMSKKHFVLTGIVFSALSMGIVSAAPIATVNIVDDNGNVGAVGTTFTNEGNITLGRDAGATTSNHQVVNSANANGNNVAIGAFAGNQSKGGGNITLGGKSFQNGTGDLNVIAGAMAANNAKLSTSIIMGTNLVKNLKGKKNVWAPVITKGPTVRLPIPF